MDRRRTYLLYAVSTNYFSTWITLLTIIKELTCEKMTEAFV